MVVSEDLIKQALKSDRLKTLKSEHKHLRMHYDGIGKDEYLSQISGLESKDQINLRKKYARSNKDLFANLTAPVNKIFSAKGKNKQLNLKNPSSQENLKDYLSYIPSIGRSLEKWLQAYWKDKLATDPNGIFLIEIDENQDVYPTYKSILSIRDYKVVGQKLEYIIFEPFKVKQEQAEITFVRVYDDTGDNLYLVKDNRITYLEDQSYPNPWGYVPGVVISDIEDTTTGFKRSSIYNEKEIADEYFRDNSVKTIYKFAHGFPLFWQYLSPCPVCKGTKELNGDICPACNGVGYSLKKDVSDIIGLKPPENPDDVTIAPDVAGYVTPPGENLEQMTTELTFLNNLMQYSHWGTTRETGDNNTATGKWIDTQPVYDRLNVYSDSLELIEEHLTNIIGVYMFRESYKGSSINYGRRYLIESADALLDKYMKVKKDNTILAEQVHDEYLQSQFSNDPLTLEYYRKLTKLEPWTHLSISQLPQNVLGTEDYKKKIYFSEWIKTTTLTDVVATDIKKLQRDFENFIKTKQNGTTEEV